MSVYIIKISASNGALVSLVLKIVLLTTGLMFLLRTFMLQSLQDQILKPVIWFLPFLYLYTYTC